ncbi:MAG: glycosyltransferase family 4 protein, partial [Mucilaginibacter polytrichastri]|nr:glycosyltransferase family 4 protein [Mucilaginibacter polytrichastri]
NRVFVAPLRYGAGMKGKIGQALEFSLPIVSTSIGSEGMDMKDGFNYILANTAEEIAAAILHLYQSEEEWNMLSQNSAVALEKYRPEAVTKTIKDLINTYRPDFAR